MLGFDDDMHSVFFGGDFAATFERQRAGVAVQAVRGILGVLDDEALDGRVIAAARVLRLPAGSDLRAGDLLQTQQAQPALGVAAGALFKVLEPPLRVNDGAELEALLGSVQ